MEFSYLDGSVRPVVAQIIEGFTGAFDDEFIHHLFPETVEHEGRVVASYKGMTRQFLPRAGAIQMFWIDTEGERHSPIGRVVGGESVGMKTLWLVRGLKIASSGNMMLVKLELATRCFDGTIVAEDIPMVSHDLIITI